MAKNAAGLLAEEEFFIKEQATEILKEIAVLVNATHRIIPGSNRVMVDVKSSKNMLIRIRNNARRIIKAARAVQKFL